MNNTPFSKWSCDQVCAWLEDYGLGQYVPMASQWVSSGQTLLSASPHDFEKVHSYMDNYMDALTDRETIPDPHRGKKDVLSKLHIS